MTPVELAKIHRASFTTPAPWQFSDFASFIADQSCQLFTADQAFLLLRKAGPEAEILSLAVHPDNRRKGIGTALVQDAISHCESAHISDLFLEVAAGNTAAISLYESNGFAPTGRRKAYYQAPDGTREDALIMARSL